MCGDFSMPAEGAEHGQLAPCFGFCRSWRGGRKEGKLAWLGLGLCEGDVILGVVEVVVNNRRD